MKKVGVIFGGKSVEHEISIISALQAIENFDSAKYDVLPIYISKNSTWYASYDFKNIEVFKDMNNLEKKYNEVVLEKFENNVRCIEKKSGLFKKPVSFDIDMILTVVHGTNVEDGTLAGYLKTLDIPFVGPTTISGPIGQDKAVMKDILKAHNINQLDYLWFYENKKVNDISSEVLEKLGLPVILKPALLGSSVGIEIANTREELEMMIQNCFSYCHKIVIEKLAIDFREMNVSVLGDYESYQISAIEEVSKNDEILSFEDKYMSNSKSKSSGMESLDRIIPAQIDKELESKIKEIAAKTFEVLNASGVVRIDLMILNNEVYINEINNMPGSLSFYLWKEVGITYPDLLDKLVNIGVKSYFRDQKVTYSFDSNVLSASQGSKNGK